jgi:hypothetical protein
MNKNEQELRARAREIMKRISLVSFRWMDELEEDVYQALRKVAQDTVNLFERLPEAAKAVEQDIITEQGKMIQELANAIKSLKTTEVVEKYPHLFDDSSKPRTVTLAEADAVANQIIGDDSVEPGTVEGTLKVFKAIIDNLPEECITKHIKKNS